MIPSGTNSPPADGESISADVRDASIENDQKDDFFQLFSDNLAVVLDCLILKDEHNQCTLSLNIKLICIRCETGKKSSTKAHFCICF